MFNIAVFRNLDMRRSDDVLLWPAHCDRFYRHSLRSRCWSLRIFHGEFCVSRVQGCNQKHMGSPVKSYACSAGLFIRKTILPCRCKTAKCPGIGKLFYKLNYVAVDYRPKLSCGYTVGALYHASSSLSKHPFVHNIISI